MENLRSVKMSNSAKKRALLEVEASSRTAKETTSINYGRWIGYGAAKDIIETLADEKESCYGCIHSPKTKRDTFPETCGECSRFYGDRYESSVA